jgi:hypothetical protein
MKRLIPLLTVIPVLLSVACNLARAMTEHAITATPSERPAMEMASPTPVHLPPTVTPTVQPLEPIVYYYFVEIESESPPAGSVVVFQDVYILGPTLSDKARSPDTVTNLSSALQAMLNDPRNGWVSTNVSITSITFKDGAARVVLEGEYFGVGDVTLIAARDQILFTVFAEAAVQTATITLNGKNIANLGVSNSIHAKPEDYTYIRADVEDYMAKNAYKAP